MATSVKDASAGGGVGVIMMSSQERPGKEAGLGLGGGSAREQGRRHDARPRGGAEKETIEAYKDDNRARTSTTEIRRKTERGTATVAYIHARPRPSRRAAPPLLPPCPRNRRAAVQTYFIRKQ